MGDVTEFPGGRRPPTLPPLSDVWADPKLRERDAEYVLAVLKARLPPESLRHVAGLDLASIARAILLEIDTVRHGRRFDTRYDEKRAGGELMGLAEMFGGPPRPVELAQPERPLATEPERPDWQGRREADALAALFETPARPEPPDCA